MALNRDEEDDEALLLEGRLAYERVESLLSTISKDAATPRLDLGSRAARSVGAQSNEMLRQLDEYDFDDDRMSNSLHGAYRVMERRYKEPEEFVNAGFQGSQRKRTTLVHLEQERAAAETASSSVDLIHTDEHVKMARQLVVSASGDLPHGCTKTLEAYYACCQEALQLAGPRLQAGTQGRAMRQTFDGRRAIEDDAAARLRQEKDTWKLLHMLHSSLLEKLDRPSDGPPQSVFEHEYSRDKTLQRWNVVVRWLHHAAGEETAERPPRRRGPYLPKTTKLGLNGQRVGLQVDPDAVQRGPECNLDPDDQDDRIALLETLWRLVRRGAFYCDFRGVDERRARRDTHVALSDEAIAACEEYGEPWRVASMGGGAPFTCGANGEWVGNSNRAIWKRAARVAAASLLRQASQPPAGQSSTAKVRAAVLEGTIYAALAGDLDLLLSSPLCRAWREQMWAYFLCMVQSRLDCLLAEDRMARVAVDPHFPGPDTAGPEAELRTAASALALENEHKVLAKVHAAVPAADEYFFAVQRAMVEGHFRALLEGRASLGNAAPGQVGLCQLLCGADWPRLNLATIVEVCGQDFAVRAAVRTIGDEIAARASVAALAEKPPAKAPCWDLENRAFAVQLLRFVAHASIYMTELTSISTVVDEDSCAAPHVAEAAVLAYVRFLLVDKTFILDRYAFLPVFYKTFVHADLALAIHASVLEAAAFAPASAKAELLQHWLQIIHPEHLQAQAARLAVRNVRRQWLTRTAPGESISVALREIRLLDHPDLDESGVEDIARARLLREDDVDVRLRLLETWQWLKADETTRHEALVQANALVRDLVAEAFRNTESQGHEIAADFMDKAVDPFAEAIETAESTSSPYLMTFLHDEVVQRERTCWHDFLSAQLSIARWKEDLSSLVAQGLDRHTVRAPSSLPLEIARAAMFTRDQILRVLRTPGGWLVDPPERSLDVESFVAGMCQVRAFEEDPVTELERLERVAAVGRSCNEPGTLRKLCVQHMVKSYMEVLSTGAEWVSKLSGPEDKQAELLSAAMLVVPVLADESLGLAVCFERDEMKALLERVRRAGNKLVGLRRSIVGSLSSFWQGDAAGLLQD